MRTKRIAILGFGTMGHLIADGLLRAGHPRKLIRATTRTPEAASRAAKATGLAVGTDNVAAVDQADVVLLAVKPMKARDVVLEVAAGGAIERATLISIAAGVSTALLEEAAGPTVAVVRAMPNTPCAIGRGMTALSPGAHASAVDLRLARRIFEPLGRVVELEEKHMDTVTGLSASGPAFVYVILEALADGGVARGLPRQVAIEMAAQMVFGAAAMVLESGRHPAALKDDVTTPAGCTIAGILALEDGKIRSVLSRAVEIAARRAGELAAPVPSPRSTT
jgi:pyrroline-5-carboxylate reductase